MKDNKAVAVLNNPSPARWASSPTRGEENGVRGFTLMELLVVVLIIGILAAVAVPQYQMAVLKSKFATLKDMVHSLEKAEEIYYLANGKYVLSFDSLDIDIPAGSDEQETTRVTRTFNWGMCRLTSPRETVFAVSCALNNDSFGSLKYQVFLNHSENSGERLCYIGTADLSNSASKVCQNETGKTTPDNTSKKGYMEWWYN